MMGKAQIRGKSILVAEDEQGVREAIKLLLLIDDHTVTEAETGVRALDLFKRKAFDLVITDYEMPRMKGNELAKKIKEVSPTQPIIMITAFSDKVAGSENPVDAIVHKPFQLADLRQTMAEVLS
jgi:two-component system response regulator SaeR